MQIGAVAKKIGLSVDAIRFYVSLYVAAIENFAIALLIARF